MTIQALDIHPDTMYIRLQIAMQETIREIHTIPNATPLLKTCQICHGREISSYVTIQNFPMHRCSSCGLVFCNPYPSHEQLHFCYNANWTLIENALFRETFEKRIPIFLPRVELIRKHTLSGTLLDIGSSIGIFIEALTRSGMPYETTCCELNPRSCDELHERFPTVRVLNNDFMELEDDTEYDVVTLWDTLEHLVDLNGALAQVKKLLAPAGILVFSTPNTASFEWRVAGPTHRQLAPPTHVNLLNPKAVELLLANNGFELLDVVTANASLDISAVKLMIETDLVTPDRVGLFLREEIYKPEFEKILEEYLVQTHQAGNMVIVTRIATY